MKLVLVLFFLVLAALPLRAQGVVIPDPGLDAAIRDTLHKPTGPLSQQDLLNLTQLSAVSRSITNLQGLEFAHNLNFLDLQSNRLSNLSFPLGMTKLSDLNLSFNPLGSCSLPTGLTNLMALTMEASQLSSVTVPADMTALTIL